MQTRLFIAAALAFMLSACNSVYYGAMEKIGVHKREIMVDRVKAARDSQDQAKQQFLTAMEQFKKVVQFQGGDLEKQYNQLSAALQKSESEAEAVRNRIDAVEDVSEALFDEWHAEIKQYTSEALRRASQRKYEQTKRKYATLIAAMHKAEAKLEPALLPLRDQVLFMKHNLNARAIAGLGDELIAVQGNVDALIRDMEAAIAQADQFIAALKTE